MIAQSLKLTSYFGERQRVDGQFFSEALLDLFEQHRVATSILLRATGGYGLKHHLRGDQQLTMSEDPSVMAVAVDSTARMAPLVPHVARLQRRGMLTVERALTMSEDLDGEGLKERRHEATKLSIHVGRHERVYRAPAYVAVCDLLHRRGIAGASVLAGVDGTSRGARHRARFFGRNLGVPTMVLAVGDGPDIHRVLPQLGGLLHDSTLTVERVTVCKRDGTAFRRPPQLPPVDAGGLGLWQKLMVYTSESQLHDGEPVHRGIIRRLRASSVAQGATALRGLWGFHGDHPPHGDRLLQVARHVPVVTVVVDTPDRIQAAYDVVDQMTAEHGLVTCEMVPAMSYLSQDGTEGGLDLASHPY